VAVGVGGDAYGTIEARSVVASISAPTASSSSRSYNTRHLVLAILLVSDGLCFVGALSLSHALRFGRMEPGMPEAVLATIAVAVWIGAFAAFGLYRPDLLSAPEELRRTISASSVGTALLSVEAFWLHSSPARSWIGLMWILAIVFELGTRRVWRWNQARLRLNGRLVFRTLVVGTDREAVKLARQLDERGNGFAVLGFVATSSSMSIPGQWPAVPSRVAGSIERLEELIREHAVQCLFVTSSLSSDEMLRLFQVARREKIEVRISANLPQTLASRVTVHDMGGAMTLCLHPVTLSGPKAAFKRGFDITFSSLGLLISLPLWLAIAVAIRATSAGPVLFRQERVTKGGRRFTIYKFRTMACDRGEEAAALNTATLLFKMENDPRLTRVGILLRRLSLDELPQLLNIVRGDMSLVGPRPLSAEQINNIEDVERLYERQEVRAGLTGWWQVNGRSNLSPEETFRLDGFYVENWSMTLDLYILIKTVGAVITQRGAY
jgi:exopolysaccharide biosynthesis polyprenyl glycosylphosphotransferase